MKNEWVDSELCKKMYDILYETFEELQDEYMHANIDVALDKIGPLIDYDYQELRNYSESMKKQYEDSELEVRRLRRKNEILKYKLGKYVPNLLRSKP
jgi:hypothetical protein